MQLLKLLSHCKDNFIHFIIYLWFIYVFHIFIMLSENCCLQFYDFGCQMLLGGMSQFQQSVAEGRCTQEDVAELMKLMKKMGIPSDTAVRSTTI